MRVILSILSEQPIPNLLFILQMRQPGDSHIFVTTREMEESRKSKILALAAGISETDYRKIIVPANDAAGILEKLDSFDWPQAECYLVNITGGTKMMSQMVYEVFSESHISRRHTEIYYWPATNAHLQRLRPTLELYKLPKPVSINLKTYLMAYGYHCEFQQSLTRPFAYADNLFIEIAKTGDAELVDSLRRARDSSYKDKDKQYLLGNWFEEWLYYKLKSILNLKDEQIAYQAKLKHMTSERNSEADNEIDIALVWQNKLYIWECKVYNKSRINSRIIGEAIYRIASIRQTLGLEAIASVAIAGDLGMDPNRWNFVHSICSTMRVKELWELRDLKEINGSVNALFKNPH